MWLLKAVILREEYRLRVFGNTMLRKIFGTKMKELTREWRTLDDEFHELHFSPNVMWVIKSRRMRRAGFVARVGEGRRIECCAGEPERKKLLVRPRRRWEDNIKTDPKD
jgi:hypothetical protein